jgi:enamine deaminase RidA (YjgF/YER057c/UK114 family)
MATKTAVLTKNAPAPAPFLSQALICQGMVYCSGSVGMDPSTSQIVKGSVKERAVCSIPADRSEPDSGRHDGKADSL